MGCFKIKIMIKTKKYVCMQINSKIILSQNSKYKFNQKTNSILKNIVPVYKKHIVNHKLVLKTVFNLNFHLGGNKLVYKNNNLKKWVLVFKNNNIIFSASLIVFKLRKLLSWVNIIASKNKLLFVNTVLENKKFNLDVLENLKRIAKRKIIISAHTWIGGSLTNYKNICRSLKITFRLPKELITEKKVLYKKAIRGLLLTRIPKLPALFFSLGDHHDSINEARGLGIKTGLILQEGTGYLSGDLTFGCNMSPLVALSYFFLFRESLFSGRLQTKLFFKKSVEKYHYYKCNKKYRLYSEL